MNGSASISGIQTAITRHDITAHDIANVQTPGYEQVTPHQSAMSPAGTRISHLSITPNDSVTLSNTDLATEAVEQNVNSKSLSANAAVIKAENRMLGELIDLVG